MRARRMRYSTLLWPQLYSRLQILLLCLLACAMVTAATITVYLLTQPDTATYTRAAERARSGLQMKLAGIDAWRWRQNFACQNMPDDCLKLKLQFGAAAADSGQHTIRLTSPEACAICHAGETAQFAQLHAVFPSLPASSALLWPAQATAATLSALCIGLAFAFFQLRRRAQIAGNCVAALCIADAAPKIVRRWFRRLNRSPFTASYVEREELRMRWITTPEKFARWLEAEKQNLRKNRDYLKLVAIQGDADRVTALPIEMLRFVYRFLASPSPAPVIVDEKLIANKEEKVIYMRRLVAKNKSGASLRLIIWEPE